MNLYSLIIITFSIFSFIFSTGSSDNISKYSYESKPIIVIDFDVIAYDAFDRPFRELKELANYYGYKHPNKSEISYQDKKKFSTMSSEETCEYLKMGLLAKTYFKYKLKKLNWNLDYKLELISGAFGFLWALKSNNYRIIILTNRSRKSVKKFLDKNHLRATVARVYTHETFHENLDQGIYITTKTNSCPFIFYKNISRSIIFPQVNDEPDELFKGRVAKKLANNSLRDLVVIKLSNFIYILNEIFNDYSSDMMKKYDLVSSHIYEFYL